MAAVEATARYSPAATPGGMEQDNMAVSDVVWTEHDPVTTGALPDEESMLSRHSCKETGEARAAPVASSMAGDAGKEKVEGNFA